MATASPPAPPAAPSARSSFGWLSRLLNSSVGGKFVVAITGLGLTGFVVMHMLGNLQIFLGRDVYNHYAQSLKDLGVLLWVARGGLLAFFLFHLALALRFFKRNADARPVRYVYERTKKASVQSRYMWLTGITILLFVIFHLAHFTFGVVDRVENRKLAETTNYLDLKDPTWHDPVHPEVSRHDTYAMFIDGFRNVPVSILYIVCMVLLGLHLKHGVRSSFQTLGINSVKVNSGLNLLGDGLAYAVVAANVFMPIAVMTRLIGADIP